MKVCFRGHIIMNYTFLFFTFSFFLSFPFSLSLPLSFFVLILAVPKPGTVIKMEETGTTVTYTSTTAESVAPNGTKVTLHGLDLWSEFHKVVTEMIITKAGRQVKLIFSILYYILFSSSD